MRLRKGFLRVLSATLICHSKQYHCGNCIVDGVADSLKSYRLVADKKRTCHPLFPLYFLIYLSLVALVADKYKENISIKKDIYIPIYTPYIYIYIGNEKKSATRHAPGGHHA